MFWGAIPSFWVLLLPPPHATHSCIPEQEVTCDRNKNLDNLVYYSFFSHGTSQTFHYNNFFHSVSSTPDCELRESKDKTCFFSQLCLA